MQSDGNYTDPDAHSLFIADNQVHLCMVPMMLRIHQVFWYALNDRYGIPHKARNHFRECADRYLVYEVD